MNAVAFGPVLDYSRRVVPGFTILLMILLAQLPVPLPFFPDITPALPLMAIYYWVVFRPDLMPRILVFALGLFQDALIGAPFGLSALIYLLAHGFVLNQRPFLVGKPFWVFWTGFAIVTPVAAFLTWLLASVLRGAILPTDVVLMGMVLTVVTFPVIAWALLHSQRWLVGSAETS
ncbi:MAG: rod shape-determining protein MreD [Rhodospirillaceae bacterium]|nr:rod shape-determining protein MreD [Rhodospirillaceae bacterium]MBT3809639.1 rod shape-determining protein MreD [Rhodospirillaceae bacterium]MBT3930116.1 rod shape-determining protein MreD [Rhodospirillaceae bacterium]MBT5358525.1 rod shape-determining protein MreD [Rhodospirillaceae bacterium]MBT5767787.1 rod shape-determining protein MreD [Rhodospirillaceae bacterium]